MLRKPKSVRLQVTVLDASPKALRVLCEARELLIPRSTIMPGSDALDVNDVGQLVVPDWVVRKAWVCR